MGIKTKAGTGALVLALGLVTAWEGYDRNVYFDPIGIPTVCYGHTEKSLALGQQFSADACHELLTSDLLIASKTISTFVTVRLHENEKAAFVSFVFNAGAENFRKSTMLKLINEGKIVEACHELPRWVYAKGKKLKGLVNRRQAEMTLCLGI